MIRLCLIACVLLLAGCAGSLEDARSANLAERVIGVRQAPANRVYCQELDEEHRAWAAWAAAGAVVTGGAGVAALPAGELPERYQGWSYWVFRQRIGREDPLEY